MGPVGTYFIVTAMTGALFLLAWLYATANNPRSTVILKKSLLLFVLPMFIWPGRWLIDLPFGLPLAAAFEEGLKTFASTREQDRQDKFWLVALFGIWELTIDKPFRALMFQTIETWDRLSLIGYVYATALPVLMHAVTAAIYAFAFRGRLWAAFLISWLIHMTFNAAVGYFGVSPVPVILETAVLSLLLLGLLVGRLSGPASEAH